jgi:hypothetical protein
MFILFQIIVNIFLNKCKYIIKYFNKTIYIKFIYNFILIIILHLNLKNMLEGIFN